MEDIHKRMHNNLIELKTLSPEETLTTSCEITDIFSAHWFLAIICYPWLIEPVQNKYIPNRPNTPGLDSLNIPTPPQPTDDNTEDMDAEENSEVRGLS